jgi:hypothetical protein
MTSTGLDKEDTNLCKKLETISKFFAKTTKVLRERADSLDDDGGFNEESSFKTSHTFGGAAYVELNRAGRGRYAASAS